MNQLSTYAQASLKKKKTLLERTK